MTNRFVELLKPYPEADLMPYYSFHPPGYIFVPAFRMGRWDGRIRFLRRNKVPTGLFLVTRKAIEVDLGVRFKVRNDLEKILFSANGISSDRDYQNECVEAMIEAANKYAGGLILSATGTGKTRLTGQFFSRLKGNGCFIVDELTLLKQAQEELSKVLGEEVGEVGDSKFLPQRITVATAQTLHLHEDDPKFEPWTESLKVNVIDEIHVQMNRRSFNIVEAIAPPVVFGLTATLELQKKHIRTRAYALAGPVCYEYPLTQGQKEGHLVQGVVVQILKEGRETATVSKSASMLDYTTDYSNCIVHDESRNELICDLLREAVKHNYFPLVLVERVAHLKLLSEMISDLPHSIICGEKKAEERLQAKLKFEAGKVKVLLANKVFQKGVDIKKVDVIIDGGGMKSKNRAVQIFGRGIRLAEGKKGLIHFDICDVGNRFEGAGKSRRRAFKKVGIPVKKVSFDDFSVGKLLLKGERFLLLQVDGNASQRARATANVPV